MKRIKTRKLNLSAEKKPLKIFMKILTAIWVKVNIYLENVPIWECPIWQPSWPIHIGCITEIWSMENVFLSKKLFDDVIEHPKVHRRGISSIVLQPINRETWMIQIGFFLPFKWGKQPLSPFFYLQDIWEEVEVIMEDAVKPLMTGWIDGGTNVWAAPPLLAFRISPVG